MANLFVSYARDDDEPFVKRLVEDLRRRRFDVWWDRAAMEARGRTFLQEIRDAIAEAERLILVVGPKAVRSDYVRVEWQFALDTCTVVIPIVRLGDDSLAPPQAVRSAHALLPAEVSKFHCPDFVSDARYEHALAELVRLLSSAIPPLADVETVVELPPNYLPRADVVDRITRALLADLYGPVVPDPNARVAALIGMPGVGKSVAAVAFARHCATRRAMGDGIYWLRLGRESDVLGTLRRFAELTGLSASTFRDVPSASAAISRRLSNQCTLIVLDDVVDAAAVWPFRDALGPRCRLLFTARNRRLATDMGATLLELDVLNEREAIDLLARCASRPLDQLPEEAGPIVNECGRLPLAIAMIGAMLRANPRRWAHALEKLRRADLEQIAGELPNYEYQNLLKAMAVSVDALTPQARERYCELAVFPENAAVPDAVVRMCWTRAGVDEHKAVDLLDDLINRSLVSRDAAGRIRIHDLQLDFVRAKVPERRGLHERLLAGYARHDGWTNGPNDGYYLEHLSHHLGEAGRVPELVALLTASAAWMIAKQRALGSHQSLLTDIDRTMKYTADVLTHAKLVAVRAIVQRQTDAHSREVLQALVWLDRLDDALSNARQSADPGRKFDALYVVYETAREKGLDVLALGHELLRTADAVTPDQDRSDSLRDLGLLLARGDGARSARAFHQARAAANRIPAPWSRARKLCELGAAVARSSAALGLEILDEAWRVVQPRLTDDESTSVQMDVALAFAAARQFDRANAVIEEMTHEGWQLNARAYLVKAYAEQDLIDEAMVRMAHDAFADEIALPELVAALSRAGRFDDARAAARKIRDVDQRAQALRTVARSLAAANAPAAREVIDEVSRIAERMPEANQQVAAFCNLALDLAEEDPRRSRAVAAAAKAFSKLSSDDRNRPEAARNLVLVLARLACLTEALDRAASIEPAGWRADALGIVALEMARRGDARAGAVVEQAIGAAATTEDEHSSSDVLSSLAALLARSRRYEAAWSVARAIPRPWTRMKSLTALGGWLAENGDARAPDVLTEAIALLPRRGFEPDLAESAGAIGAALFTAGDPRARAMLARAIQLSRKVTRSGQDIRQLAETAGVLCRIGHPRAEAIVADAEGAALDASTRGERATRLAVLAFEIHDSRPEQARALLAKAAKKTVARGAVVDESAVYDMARTYVRLGQLDDARSLVDGMSGGYSKTSNQEKLVTYLSDAGRWDDAWHVGRMIDQTTHRAVALVHLATAMARRNVGWTRRALDEALASVSAMEACPLKTILHARLVIPLVLSRDERTDAFIAEARAGDPGNANWSGIRAAAIAEGGDVSQALDAYQPSDTDSFIRTLIDWAGLFDGVTAGLAQEVVLNATRIVGWLRPDWQRVHAAILSARDEAGAPIASTGPERVPIANSDTAILLR